MTATEYSKIVRGFKSEMDSDSRYPQVYKPLSKDLVTEINKKAQKLNAQSKDTQESKAH